MAKVLPGKKFIIDRILAQAMQQEIPLTDIEVRMLDFSEEKGSKQDMEAAAIFEREYNDDEYEKKIARLLRCAYQSDKVAGERDEWDRALMDLGSEDMYLKVLLSRAQIRDPFFKKSRLWVLFGAAPIGLLVASAFVLAFMPIGARLIPNESVRLGIYVLAIVIPFVVINRLRKDD